MVSEPDVYIIESLSLSDERDELYEGEILEKVLKLSGKRPAYRYIRTKRELEEFADEFEDSRHRYLHLSMHADQTGVKLTFDHLDYEELADIFGESLANRRLFVSGCEMSNERFAQSAIGRFDAYSVLGPARKIAFDDAAVFWLAFYHLAFKIDANKILKSSITHAATNMSMLLEEPINYFTRISGDPKYQRVTIHHTDPT